MLIRSTYVLLCTIVACVIPFFSAVVGLVGAITYWPLSVFFPFVMYAMVRKKQTQTNKMNACQQCLCSGRWGDTSRRGA